MSGVQSIVYGRVYQISGLVPGLTRTFDSDILPTLPLILWGVTLQNCLPISD